MNLFEFLIMGDVDYDTFDNVYDTCVTVCVPYEYENTEEMDYYDKFTVFIYKSVKILERHKSKYSETLVVNWSEFIEKNLDTFRAIAEDMWREETIPKDNDDLVYDWINELHAWLAGYVSDSRYQEFMEKYAPLLKGVGEDESNK